MVDMAVFRALGEVKCRAVCWASGAGIGGKEKGGRQN